MKNENFQELKYRCQFEELFINTRFRFNDETRRRFQRINQWWVQTCGLPGSCAAGVWSPHIPDSAHSGRLSFDLWPSIGIIWDYKATWWEQSEERKSQKRRSQKKEDQSARKGRKVAKQCVFFQCFLAPEGRQVGSLKRWVRSNLGRWRWQIETLLWRESHFKVKR